MVVQPVVEFYHRHDPDVRPDRPRSPQHTGHHLQQPHRQRQSHPVTTHNPGPCGSQDHTGPDCKTARRLHPQERRTAQGPRLRRRRQGVAAPGLPRNLAAGVRWALQSVLLAFPTRAVPDHIEERGTTRRDQAHRLRQDPARPHPAAETASTSTRRVRLRRLDHAGRHGRAPGRTIVFTKRQQLQRRQRRRRQQLQRRQRQRRLKRLLRRQQLQRRHIGDYNNFNVDSYVGGYNV